MLAGAGSGIGNTNDPLRPSSQCLLSYVVSVSVPEQKEVPCHWSFDFGEQEVLPSWEEGSEDAAPKLHITSQQKLPAIGDASLNQGD